MHTILNLTINVQDMKQTIFVIIFCCFTFVACSTPPPSPQEQAFATLFPIRDMNQTIRLKVSEEKEILAMVSGPVLQLVNLSDLYFGVYQE